MRVSTKARYAVMAMVELAQISQTGKVGSLSTISLRQNLPLPYLEQLFAKLRKAGLVKSIRGAGGGYIPAQKIGSIRIFDIIMSVEQPIKATRCETNSVKGCHTDGARCLTHDLWAELEQVVVNYLKSVTLEDACNKRIPGIVSTIEKIEPSLECMVE